MIERADSLFFCFAGPTASGKSTISRRLVDQDPELLLSISTTTRKPRTGEVDGKHYYFVDETEFERRIQQQLFLEHAEFSGHRYGTELRNLERARNERRDMLLDIEVQGVVQLKKLLGKQVITTFVFPPSFKELEKRLRARASESEEQIQRRLEVAHQEVAQLAAPGFSDYFLLNEDLASAVSLARSIIQVSRSRLDLLDFAQLSKLLK
jgi:guanylate kinase